MIVEYGIVARFDKLISNRCIEFECNDTVICTKKGMKGGNAFGQFDATIGYIHQWTLEVLDDVTDANIGVIKAGKYYLRKWWSSENYGYSVSIGSEYNVDFKYNGVGDKITIQLDLKDNFDFSYFKHGQKYRKSLNIDVDKTYRLGVALNAGKLRLVSLQSWK